MKRIISTLIGGIFVCSTYAEVLSLAEGAPKSYVVAKDDTLWTISEKFLKDPWLWQKLWRVNSEIENPHMIYPGDTLNLLFDDQGQPMLVKGKPSLKLSPSIRKSQKNVNPVETISLNMVAPFVKYDTIFSEQELSESPYILGSYQGYKSSIDGFKVYVNSDLSDKYSYAIYQKKEAIHDPETEKFIGYYSRLIGSGKVLRSGDIANKELATLYINDATREIRAGDIVIPIDQTQMLPAFFTIQPAQYNVKGQIIKSSNDLREFGKFDVVFVNQGLADGVRQGDILSVTRQSSGVVESDGGLIDTQYKMPYEPIGEMMVFRVFDQISMALILRSEKPLRLFDHVTAP